MIFEEVPNTYCPLCGAKFVVPEPKIRIDPPPMEITKHLAETLPRCSKCGYPIQELV